MQYGVGFRLANAFERRMQDGVIHGYVQCYAGCGEVADSRPLFSLAAVHEYLDMIEAPVVICENILEAAAEAGLPKEKTDRDLFLEGIFEELETVDDEVVGDTVEIDLSSFESLDDGPRPSLLFFSRNEEGVKHLLKNEFHRSDAPMGLFGPMAVASA